MTENKFIDLLSKMVFSKIIGDFKTLHSLWQHFLENPYPYFPDISRAQLDKQIEIFNKEGKKILLLDELEVENKDES